MKLEELKPYFRKNVEVTFFDRDQSLQYDWSIDTRQGTIAFRAIHQEHEDLSAVDVNGTTMIAAQILNIKEIP